MTDNTLRFSTDTTGRKAEIFEMMRAAFAASEGAAEGDLIATLARDLLETTQTEDLCVCLADDDNGGHRELAGAIFFSRLTYPEDPRTVFVLGPVAIAPARQRQGVGLALLRYGLEQQRAQGVEVALTYGNPAYYGKVGYMPISQDDIAAPYPLQHAFGWLGQSLTDAPLGKLAGPATCVPAFADPAYW